MSSYFSKPDREGGKGGASDDVMIYFAGGYILLGFLGKMRINVSPSMSGTYAPTTNPDTPAVPADPPPVAPGPRSTYPDLEPVAHRPLAHDLKKTTKGGYHAPRYIFTVFGKSKSSSHSWFIGQQPDHLHAGVDVEATGGEAVLAPDTGEARSVDPGPLGGPEAVAVVTPTRRWVFCHVTADKGLPRSVVAGQTIATVGPMDHPHLHIGLSVPGVAGYVDPSVALGLS